MPRVAGSELEKKTGEKLRYYKGSSNKRELSEAIQTSSDTSNVIVHQFMEWKSIIELPN